MISNYCKACGTDFGSVAAFDSHRVGVHDYTYSEGLLRIPAREHGRRCRSAREIGTVKLTDPSTGAVRGPLFARNKAGRWSLAQDLSWHGKGGRRKPRSPRSLLERLL